MRYGCVIGVVYSEILNAVGLSMALEPSQQIFFTAQTYLGGGYKHVLFSLYLGKIPILTNIFQRG